MEELINDNWRNILKKEFKKDYFLKLKSFVDNSYLKPNLVFPSKELIFRALNCCDFEKIKVVIIGQDPYPGKGHANGLSFSVSPETFPLPKSLKNIFKELQNDLDCGIPKTGNLEKWANQGVLLLNSVLTVESGCPDSHSNKGWEVFTDKIIELISIKSDVVFILWGNKSQKKSYLINSSNNLVLKAPHPSPLSAYRGFFGCSHFSLTNNYLLSKSKKPIDWVL